ncbi:MAG: ATP-binding protein [Spartobacteria bacterium]
MADSSSFPPSPDPSVTVPWSDVVRFVRQLSHDLRNHLNAVELQSVLLNELTDDPELKGEVKRLREMLSTVGGALQKVSASLTIPKLTLMPYRAGDLFEDIRKKFENDFPAKKTLVQWNVDLAEAMLEVDPQLLQQVLLELLDNAFREGSPAQPIAVSARRANNGVTLTMREAKTQFDRPTEEWGRGPLRHVSHGHYGLGLNRARGIIEAHGGSLKAEYDSGSSTLITTVALPATNAVG